MYALYLTVPHDLRCREGKNHPQKVANTTEYQ
jgi:hypothetical protein